MLKVLFWHSVFVLIISNRKEIRMIKRNLIKTLLVIACLSTSLLVGCGSKSKEAETSTKEVVATEKSTSVVTEKATEKPTEKATEVVAVKVTEKATEKATEKPTEKPTEAPKPDFTVADMNKTMYATQGVNVRAGASTNYDVIGSLSWAQGVKVTGQASTGWYRIDYNGQVGYCSNSYLSDSQPQPQVKETQAPQKQEQPTQAPQKQEQPKVIHHTDKHDANNPNCGCVMCCPCELCIESRHMLDCEAYDIKLVESGYVFESPEWAQAMIDYCKKKGYTDIIDIYEWKLECINR